MLNPRYETPMDEAVDRLRRIETRLTAFMEAQGFVTKAVKPMMDGYLRMAIPNINVSLRDVINAAGTCRQEFPLVLDGEIMAYIRSV